ncbi:hypothetical protein RI367_004211 [Sorochytrium milnesiophthora]
MLPASDSAKKAKRATREELAAMRSILQEESGRLVSTTTAATTPSLSSTPLLMPLTPAPPTTPRTASFMSAPTSAQHDVFFVQDKDRDLSAKRPRTVMSAYQTAVLKRILAVTAFPSTELREKLAKALEMTPRTVQIWFQNQRQKAKAKSSSSSTIANAATSSSSTVSSSALGLGLVQQQQHQQHSLSLVNNNNNPLINHHRRSSLPDAAYAPPSSATLPTLLPVPHTATTASFPFSHHASYLDSPTSPSIHTRHHQQQQQQQQRRNMRSHFRPIAIAPSTPLPYASTPTLHHSPANMPTAIPRTTSPSPLASASDQHNSSSNPDPAIPYKSLPMLPSMRRFKKAPPAPIAVPPPNLQLPPLKLLLSPDLEPSTAAPHHVRQYPMSAAATSSVFFQAGSVSVSHTPVTAVHSRLASPEEQFGCRLNPIQLPSVTISAESGSGHRAPASRSSSPLPSLPPLSMAVPGTPLSLQQQQQQQQQQKPPGAKSDSLNVLAAVALLDLTSDDQQQQQQHSPSPVALSAEALQRNVGPPLTPLPTATTVGLGLGLCSPSSHAPNPMQVDHRSLTLRPILPQPPTTAELQMPLPSPFLRQSFAEDQHCYATLAYGKRKRGSAGEDNIQVTTPISSTCASPYSRPATVSSSSPSSTSPPLPPLALLPRPMLPKPAMPLTPITTPLVASTQTTVPLYSPHSPMTVCPADPALLTSSPI